MKDCSSFVGLQVCESSINLTEGAYIIICTIIPMAACIIGLYYRPVCDIYTFTIALLGYYCTNNNIGTGEHLGHLKDLEISTVNINDSFH
jgi:hypothetical protein